MNKELRVLLQTIRKELNANFKERGDLVDGLLLAIVAGEHLFALGLPGTTKSALMGNFAEALERKDAPYFQRTLHKQMPEQEIFNNYSFKSIENDEFLKVTKGRIYTAFLMFLDEIWKCNGSTLNAMLRALNERQFENGDDIIDLPLHTCMSASNEMPQGRELGALFDRFVLRFFVSPIIDDDEFKKMLLDNIKPLTKVTKTQILSWGKEAASLTIPDNVITEIVKIRRAIQEQGIYVSDRTYKKLIKMVRCQAYLDGADEVRVCDLQILRHMAWNDPENRGAISKLVLEHTHPGLERVVQVEDSLRQLAAKLQEIKDDKDLNDDEKLQEQRKVGPEYMAKAGDAIAKLEKMQKEYGGMAVINDAMSRAKSLQRYVVYDIMKMKV